MVLESRRIQPLANTSPFGEFCTTPIFDLASPFPFPIPPPAPAPARGPRPKKKKNFTHYARLFDTPWPCDRKTCICLWVASRTRAAFPLASAGWTWSSLLLLLRRLWSSLMSSARGRRPRWRRRCPPCAAVCAGALFAARTFAMGFSCKRGLAKGGGGVGIILLKSGYWGERGAREGG